MVFTREHGDFHGRAVSFREGTVPVTFSSSQIFSETPPNHTRPRKRNWQHHTTTIFWFKPKKREHEHLHLNNSGHASMTAFHLAAPGWVCPPEYVSTFLMWIFQSISWLKLCEAIKNHINSTLFVWFLAGFSQNLQGQNSMRKKMWLNVWTARCLCFWTPTIPSDLRGSSLVLLETSKWPRFGKSSKIHKGSRCVSRPKPCSRDQRHRPLSQPPPLCSKNSPFRSAEPKSLAHLQHAISKQKVKSTHTLLSHYMHLKEKKSPASTPHRFSSPQSNALHRSTERSKTLRPDLWGIISAGEKWKLFHDFASKPKD